MDCARPNDMKDRHIPTLPAMMALATITFLAAVLSWLAIWLTRPWLTHAANAPPQARSSHRLPTPQGAGLGVIAASTTVAGIGLIALGQLDNIFTILWASVVGLTALGFADDVCPLSWRQKLAGQSLCAVVATTALPVDQPLFSPMHLFWLERAGMAVFLVITINVVNFIDGIDEITVAHAAPALATFALAAQITQVGATASVASASGFGALIGFWLWNRHPARIFLGDAGSLPVGLLLGWLSLLLAGRGHAAAALLVLAYPLADGGSTLLRRLVAGKQLTQPHRDHAYQRAVDTGLAVRQVSRTVLFVSVACGVLALTALLAGGGWIGIGALVIGLVWVAIPIIGWLRRPLQR